MFRFKYKKIQTTGNDAYIDKEMKKWQKNLFVAFLVVMFLFFCFYGWYIYFVRTYATSKVVGMSMQSTLNPNTHLQSEFHDLVYVNMNRSAVRGDIIILEREENDPEFGKSSLIKRLIAMPGDWVSIFRVSDENHPSGEMYFHVFLQQSSEQQAKRLEENYIKDYAEWSRKASYVNEGISYEAGFYDKFLSRDTYNIEYKEVDGLRAKFFQVPEGEIFYLGDNRLNSSDARANGTKKIEKIVGIGEIIVHDYYLEGANELWLKFKAIISYYWGRLTAFFAR